MQANYVREQERRSALVDEETRMKQYVEQELAKRLGKEEGGGAAAGGAPAAAEEEEDGNGRGNGGLYAAPRGLAEASLKRDVVISGMLSAIAEVDVSREARLAQLEAAERARQELIDRAAEAAGGGGGGGAGGGAGLASASAAGGGGGGGIKRSDFVGSFGKRRRGGGR
jgi:hypothetical protein